MPTKDGTTPTKSRTKSLFAAHADLGIPRPFTLERLAAILRIVHPHGISYRAGGGISDRIYRELGELEKLRLVVSIGISGAGDGAAEEKWRINVGRDWVVNMGQNWGLGIREYEMEHDI